MTAIAIVGMGCRFANAPDLHAYWEMTCKGIDGFGPIPSDRWDHEVFFNANRRVADKTYAPRGAFIDDVRSFPALALSIPPRRVEVMDPQQRFAIEMAIEAILDGGYRPGEMPYRTGVYMGVTATEFRMFATARIVAQLMASGTFGETPEDGEAIANAVNRLAPPRPFTAPGVLANMVAASVAQELDLHGPAYTTDAACASSLVAIHNAVQDLRNGSTDAAIAGGVYLCLTPDHHVAFSRIGAMSASGECLPFDERADGFVQGDGAACVLLKRLEDAQADGDRIYAVLEGIAINNDGHGDGPMAPVESGQQDVIERAWADSGLSPDQLGYVETHGTGTVVGDVTEFRALCKSLGRDTKRAALGSSKANVGHTMSAAGVAGVIRAALALHFQTIPPMANFQSPKSELGLDDTPFFVPNTMESWTGEGRTAGVSSFGFGGTNVHVVLRSEFSANQTDTSTTLPQQELVTLSAPDMDQLQSAALRMAEVLVNMPNTSVSGIARTLSKRTPQACRLGIVVSTMDELIHHLRECGRGEFGPNTPMGTAEESPKLAFLYPGQGAQRIGMLREISQRFPVVADTLNELEHALGDALSLPLTHLLYPEKRSSSVSEDAAAQELTHTAHCQPVMFACAEALTQLLAQCGVTPDVVAGHSLGEFNAAVQAGVLTPVDGVQYVARRGQRMASVEGDPGTMAAIMADEKTTLSLLEDGVTIANYNHPSQFVVSGPTEGVQKVIQKAEAQDIRAVALNVSHGFHSSVFTELPVKDLVEDISFCTPSTPFASSILAHPIQSADDAKTMFLNHASSPVHFSRALEQCVDAGATHFLQIGAGGPLRAFARGTVGSRATAVDTLATRDDEDGGRSLLITLAWLWVRGVPVNVEALTQKSKPVTLPPHCLPRERYWPIKEKAQKRLEIQKGRGTQDAPAEPEAHAEHTTDSTQAEDPTGDQVLSIIARVSAYPKHALKPSLALLEDLGFDSLMIGDLATGLADVFPGLDGIPQEMLINRPTVGDIIEYAKGNYEGSATPDDDDHAVNGYGTRWTPTPLTHSFRSGVQQPKSVVVTGEKHLAEALSTALEQAGVEHVHTTDVDAAEWASTDLLVYCGPNGENKQNTSPSDAAEEGGKEVNSLITILDHYGRTDQKPDLILLRDNDCYYAEGLAGITRCVAREWPENVAKTLHFQNWPDPTTIATCLLSEWADADRTVDVHYGSDERSIFHFHPLEPTQTYRPITDTDTILITGGTRGIGLAFAERLTVTGAKILILGRSELSETANALVSKHPEQIIPIQADVCDFKQLNSALAPHGDIQVCVHGAGVLADGAIGSVSKETGALARQVKVQGWLNTRKVCGNALEVSLCLGSWAGRFGNRHQCHYAAANALLAALVSEDTTNTRCIIAEFGPWSESEMTQTIPPPVQAAMRGEGVDFVTNRVGLDGLMEALTKGEGVWTMGRKIPYTSRIIDVETTLSTDSHPYLLDHAIDGVPIFPLAAAADLIAHHAGLCPPFEIQDLKLFSGIPVDTPISIHVHIRGNRAELRQGDNKALAYRATVLDSCQIDSIPESLPKGDTPDLSLSSFYEDVTFHGPKLQGLRKVLATTSNTAKGEVDTGVLNTWIPSSSRQGWTIDPLSLDSSLQLCAYLLWLTTQRKGTPVGIKRYAQLAPWPTGPLTADVILDDSAQDRFSGRIVLRDGNGANIAYAEGVVGELREGADDGEDLPLTFDSKWIKPGEWEEVKDLEMRLQMAEVAGIQNPYFSLHEGTAKNTTTVDGRELTNYSSYNYLGLSGDRRVLEDVHKAIERYGTSVSASRVASGERPFHQELEAELARCQGVEDALVFTAGHATNVTTVGHLFGANDLILHDELIHDSILQGIKLSGSARQGYRHEDPEHLEERLRTLRSHHEKTLIIVEGVYSMDGDVCLLPEYIRLKHKYGCLLMVDEAHSFGVIGKTGQGAREHFEIDGTEVDLWMGTLSKSLASCGGWIGGSKHLINYLRYTAPGFVYSAGITPANAQAALSSLRLMLKEPERVKQLQDNAKIFYTALHERGLDTGPAKGASGVIPCVTGNSFHALMLSQRLLDLGINVQPIVYPAVPDDAARLRFFLSSTHTKAELLHTAECIHTTLEAVKSEFPEPS